MMDQTKLNKNRTQEFDEKMMKLALKLARKSQDNGEVPIGAVIVNSKGEIISKATNLREQRCTVLGHAELSALHKANKKLNSWRLIDCTLYVTLEPCFMCAAAIQQARIARVVYGAKDPKNGALGSLADLSNDKRLNHQFEVTTGVLENDCSQILKKFFKQKRLLKKITY